MLLSGLWQDIEAADNAAVFVVSDQSMRTEGSDFLLRSVLLAPENRERLRSLLAHHIVLQNTAALYPPYTDQQIPTHAGDCLTMQVVADALLIGADARLETVVATNNGKLLIVDRLLWTPYQNGPSCADNK